MSEIQLFLVPFISARILLCRLTKNIRIGYGHAYNSLTVGKSSYIRPECIGPNVNNWQ